MLIVHTERELEKVLNMVGKESTNYNCKKKNSKVVSKKDNIYTIES